MRFALSREQHGFARSLDDLLTGADTPAAARAWAAGDPEPGRALWRRLADLGVAGLAVPEAAGGLGASPVDLVVAFEALGRHAVPGPWVESAACVPVLLAGLPGVGQDPRETLSGLADGREVLTLAAPPWVPFALDADAATRALLLEDGALHTAATGCGPHCSVDPARRLFDLRRGDRLGGVPGELAGAALVSGALACAAQLLGLGERLLEMSVGHAGTRRQFGRPVGGYQAVKHALADVRVGLDFARPLVHGAAASVAAASADAVRDVSAAKVAAGGSAYRAARTALQVHGAVGYTAEHDLSLWLGKVRALVAAWGTAGDHRARVLDAVSGSAGP